ncbi:hypothetical protein KAU11_08050 [Candidatus Babeliales bacterium]|nr:hypothetical protein [Candidatus Babeliales bacterium]
MKDLRYVDYTRDSQYWQKWRLAFEGGQDFIQSYLKRFTSREDVFDFAARREMTYSPSFAKEALIDIRNSIFQRMVEVQRHGSEAYVEACNLNVDGAGTTMTQFMGSQALDELLVVGRVGIWVDKSEGETYMYMYKVEDIYNWDDAGNPTNILLRDYEPDVDDEFGLSTTPKEQYRHARVVGDTVEVQTLNTDKERVGDVEVLDFDILPFVMLSIQESLMKDIANYQVALLNLASSDMSYVLRANFPFYTEQYDAKADMMSKYMDQAPEGDEISQPEGQTTKVGVTTGKRYPLGVERPGFIAPPVEPLQASMEKQAQLKQEIRILVNLSLSNISPTRASRDSKQQDEKGLEAGLSCLGQELEKAERKIAKLWHLYEGYTKGYSVSYPKDYSLKTDAERQAEAESDLKLIDRLPSQTAKKELSKKMLSTLFGGRLAAKQLNVILEEVDALEVVITDPDRLYSDLENHLVGNKTASMSRGYSEAESEQAQEDHAAKLSRIAVAQSEASLIAAGGANPDTPGVETSKTEKEKKDVRDT